MLTDVTSNMVFLVLASLWFLNMTVTTSTEPPSTSIPNMTVSGHTQRGGIFYVSVGEYVNITCTATSSKYNASHLVIVYNETQIDNVTQIDDVTVQFSVIKKTPGRYLYFYRCCVDVCPLLYFESAGVTVKFAYPTLPVTNLTCVSPDFKGISCFWTVPNLNDQVLWTMTYCVHGVSGTDFDYLSCSSDSYRNGTCKTPFDTQSGGKIYFSCAINISDFFSRQTYTIKVIGKSHHSNMFIETNVTTRTNIVQYSPLKTLELLRPPSFHNLTIQWSEPVHITQADPEYRITVLKLLAKGKIYNGIYYTNRTVYTLTGLSPGTSYTIQVQAKPKQSRFWSDPNNITATTNETSYIYNAATHPSPPIKAIVGVSVPLALIIVTVISCIVYHRRRFFPKIPIDVPNLIQDDSFTGALDSIQLHQSDSHDESSTSHVNPLGSAESSPNVNETCNNGSPMPSSDTSSWSSILNRQQPNVPSVTSEPSPAMTPRRGASSYVTVDVAANSVTVSSRHLESKTVESSNSNTSSRAPDYRQQEAESSTTRQTDSVSFREDPSNYVTVDTMAHTLAARGNDVKSSAGTRKDVDVSPECSNVQQDWIPSTISIHASPGNTISIREINSDYISVNSVSDSTASEAQEDSCHEHADVEASSSVAPHHRGAQSLHKNHDKTRNSTDSLHSDYIRLS